MVDKKSKKPLKPSQKHLLFGIPSNIAVGPLGFRAELDIDPKGQCRCYRDLVAGRPDSTAMLDGQNPRPSQIVFHDKDEAQGLPAPGTSTSAAVVGGTKHENYPPSESCGSLPLRSMFMRICVLLPLEESISDMGKEAGKPTVASRGMCRRRCVICLLLTSTSSRETPRRYSAWRSHHSRECHEGDREWIRPPQSHLGNRLRPLYGSRSSLTTSCLKRCFD